MTVMAAETVETAEVVVETEVTVGTTEAVEVTETDQSVEKDTHPVTAAEKEKDQATEELILNQRLYLLEVSTSAPAKMHSETFSETVVESRTSESASSQMDR